MCHKINQYGEQLSEQEILEGRHREFVGGLWDSIGLYQLNILTKLGLLPEMKLLDIGCGCLRGGIHAIRYLNKGNYFGVDSNASLLYAGYHTELKSAGLQDKLPISNLVKEENFDFSLIPTMFQFAIAFSLFTHLPLNHIKLCLTKLAPKLEPNCAFVATYFRCPTDSAWGACMISSQGEVKTWPHRDPYHYKISDFFWCIENLPWVLEDIGDLSHPRGQQFLLFRRTG